VEPPITDTNWELVIDGLAIQQALINLIDNAVKHSAAGQTVKVGLERMTMLERNGATDQASGCSKVTIFVEDQGSGIPLDQQEKIFERFYRLGSELRRETQGVGIGLSIVKHVVEAHGGKVNVRSAPGEGSRFTIELPVKEGEVADNPLTDRNV
jgi:two-component system sensor histidine kinase SenX3